MVDGCAGRPARTGRFPAFGFPTSFIAGHTSAARGAGLRKLARIAQHVRRSSRWPEARFSGSRSPPWRPRDETARPWTATPFPCKRPPAQGAVMIRNSIFISLDSFFGGTGGTGGTPQELTRTGGTDRWDQCAQGCPRGSAIFHGGPTGPTVRYHQKFENWLQYHRYPRSHPVSRLSCLGMQKRVPEILELRRPLVEDLTVLAHARRTGVGDMLPDCSPWLVVSGLRLVITSRYCCSAAILLVVSPVVPAPAGAKPLAERGETSPMMREDRLDESRCNLRVSSSRKCGPPAAAA